MRPSSPGDAAPPLLEVRGIERRYGGVTIWKDINLQVGAGELLLLAGPNGAGKTTLLRAIAGLARPPRGTIRIDGKDLYGDRSARARLGFLAHDSFLYDDLTARENLNFAAALQELPAPLLRCESALDLVGLTAHANQRVGRFSRGMVQRLSLARAMLHEPALLLLDEPFTGLDITAAAALRTRLMSERDLGRAIICVTHDPSEIWEAATRIVVLDGQQIRLDIPRPADMLAFGTQYRELVA